MRRMDLEDVVLREITVGRRQTRVISNQTHRFGEQARGGLRKGWGPTKWVKDAKRYKTQLQEK